VTLITYLVWAGILLVVMVVVLILACVESHHDALSSHVPDSYEYKARKDRIKQSRKYAGRVVAPGIAVRDARNISGADGEGDQYQSDASVQVGSSSVVEMKGLRTLRDRGDRGDEGDYGESQG
jgi:hypothetical protein